VLRSLVIPAVAGENAVKLHPVLRVKAVEESEAGEGYLAVANIISYRML